MPNWNSMTMPVATPMAKLMPNKTPQNLVMSRQIVRPVITYTVSMMASITDRPMVKGTKIKWYRAVSPNCSLDNATMSRFICFPWCFYFLSVNFLLRQGRTFVSLVHYSIGPQTLQSRFIPHRTAPHIAIDAAMADADQAVRQRCFAPQVGCDQQGTPLAAGGQAQQHVMRGGRIERLGGFVEQPQRRLVQEQPRQRQAARLPARQAQAALPQPRVQAARHDLHFRLQACRPQRFPQPTVVGLRVCQAQVVTHTVLEQFGTLCEQAGARPAVAAGQRSDFT